MLKQLAIKNPTVFPETDLQFAKHLNVIVGENGAGKTHLLKMAYAVLATSWDEGRKPAATAPTKVQLQTRLADKLVNVFRPEALGRLAALATAVFVSGPGGSSFASEDDGLLLLRNA